MNTLFQTLDQRRRPEGVAQMILLDDDLSAEESRILRRAAKGFLKQKVAQFTSMLEDFARPVPPARQVREEDRT